MKRIMTVMIAALALVASACGGAISEDEFRTQLVDQGMSTDEANCIIEGLAEAGIALDDMTDQALGDNDPPAEAIDVSVGCLLGGITDDTNLDTIMSDADNYGDDPTLDAMWDQCEAGDGAACDELYFSSPFGSAYESFGDTCGNRFEDPPFSCEAEMG